MNEIAKEVLNRLTHTPTILLDNYPNTKFDEQREAIIENANKLFPGHEDCILQIQEDSRNVLWVKCLTHSTTEKQSLWTSCGLCSNHPSTLIGRGRFWPNRIEMPCKWKDRCQKQKA